VGGHSDPQNQQLLEQVVDAENMRRAWKQVARNRGAAGVDGRSIKETYLFLRDHWPEIYLSILEGSYRPMPVLRVKIPKPGGGERNLGIPTVVDRLIQQAISQVISPYFEPEFSENSYGFRPGRSARQAIEKVKSYQLEGKRWVVDMDLKQFFDEVNHDILMSRLGRKIRDKRLKRLINAILKAGVKEGEETLPTPKGTPQGGPLSPLLSNILLDDLDKELERRGHSFARYADDCNIYVKSRQAGKRVLQSITQYVEGKLKLKVNQTKSAVDRPWKRTFLGFSFTAHTGKNLKIRVPAKTIKGIKGNLKQLFRQGRGRNLKNFTQGDLNPKLSGWLNYFSLAEVRSYAEELDGWIRHHLRCLIWKQWKRVYTRYKGLRRRGLGEKRAWRSVLNGRGPWWNSGASHMNDAFKKSYFDGLGLYSLVDELQKKRRIAA
jgi:RNA-directed DNA polymerase